MNLSKFRIITIIVNPISGNYRMKRVTALTKQLEQIGFRVQVLYTRYRGHGNELARKTVKAGKSSHIVAAGGDGTVAEVAAGMIGSDVQLAILPIGTANVLAAELGILLNEKSLAQTIASGHYTILWPGRLWSSAGETLFLQMVSAGFDAHVVHVLSSRLKKIIGRMAYVLTMLFKLKCYRYPRMSVLIDGIEYQAFLVIISKGSLYAGRYVLTPHSAQMEKAFHVVLFGSSGIRAILRYSFALLCGTLSRQKDVRILPATTVEITDPTGVPVQSDGDARGFTSMRAAITDHPIRVVRHVDS